MDAVEFGGDAVLQECRLRLSLDLFFNLAVYQLVALRQSIGMSGKLGRRRCPFDSKKDRYFSRSSFSPVHFIRIPPVIFHRRRIRANKKRLRPKWDEGVCV